MDSRQSTAWISALLAVLACVGAWFVYASRSLQPVHEGTVAPEHGRASETTAPAMSGSEALEPTWLDPAASRTPIEESGGNESSTLTREIRVVLRGTETPVVGADVRCAGQNEVSASYDRTRPLKYPDIEQLLAKTAGVKSDTSGIVRVDEARVPGLVCARLGDLFGGRNVDEPRDKPIRIEMSQDLTFSVQVVDERGKPVEGVPVAVRASKSPSKGDDVATQTTEGAQGIARFAHVQDRFARQSGVWTLGVHLALVGFDAPLVPVDIEHPPTDPVRLVLPQTGVAIVLVHDSEQRVVMPDGVNLVAAVQLGADGNVPMLARAFRPERIEPGRITFAFVPLGLDLAFEVYGNGTVGHARGAGPRFAGESVTFDVDLGPAVPEIVGRLVNESAQPIADCQVDVGWTLFVSGSMRGFSSHPLRTDTGGRFRFPLSVQFAEHLGGPLTFRPSCAAYGHGEQAIVDLDGKIHAGQTDLGDVVVHPPVVIASGRVVDDLGAPVPSALFGGDDLVVEGGVETWRSSMSLGGTCDSGGHFTLKGSTGPGPFRLHAQRDGFVEGVTGRLETGASNVSIVVTRASRIMGRALLDEAGAAATIRVRVVTSAGTVEDRRLRYREQSRVHADGAFELAGLPAGRVDLEVRIDGRKDPLRVVEGIVLSPGETSTDARLGSIDLRGMISAPDPVEEKPR